MPPQSTKILNKITWKFGEDSLKNGGETTNRTCCFRSFFLSNNGVFIFFSNIFFQEKIVRYGVGKV